MDLDEVRRLWESNAPAWTALARAGHDVYRDHLNAPAFMELLPEVRGLEGLDIGCGEGHNTRLVARRGARMTEIDIAPTFVRHAREKEAEEPLGIEYLVASGTCLPFSGKRFDFCMATMSLMDMPDHDHAVREAHRVLKGGGFLQFSITHPCFQTPRWRWLMDDSGERAAVECGDYFRELDGEIEEWTFGAAPGEERVKRGKFRVPRFTRTLSSWLNLLVDAGFVIERVAEPFADDEALARCPHLADTRIVAYFLHVRYRKPLPPA
ncbi:MAG: class I SAM-dependent methyltransferase [Planctomycetota bacterium]